MRPLLIMAITLCTAQAWAADAVRSNPFGLANIYPAPAGILFPSLATAAGINPGVLGNSNRAAALQLAYGPAVESGERHHYFLGGASVRKGVGFGLGIDGTVLDGSFVTGAFAGIGVDLERAGLGVALRQGDLSSNFSPNVDVGMSIGKGSGVRAGFVLYNLESSPRAVLGIGYNNGKRYNIEANLQLPPFNSFSNGNVGLSLGANLSAEFLSFLFRATYYTSTDTLVNTLGVGVWLNKKVNLGVQFSTPHEWIGAFTLLL